MNGDESRPQADEGRRGADVFTSEQRRMLAGRARTLVERLDDPGAVTGDRDDGEVSDLLAAWRDRFPTGEAFERRLDRAGVTEADCRAALAADRLAGDESLPAWVDPLEELVAAVQSTDPGDADAPTPTGGPGDGDDGDGDRPFGALTAAIAAHARERLDDDPVRAVLPAAAVDSMAGWLRVRFEQRFTRVMYVEFKTFVGVRDRELARADPSAFDDPPTEYYEAFVDHLFSGGFADLCLRYPVFSRLLATQFRQWDEHLSEFARRLRADREALARRFADDGSLGAVTDLEPLADDTHGDGRAVMRVAFESGVAVAYKPRSVAAGERFYGLLDRLNDHLPVPEFRTPSYLSREGYGWMEWVEHAPCEDEAAAERYYRRAGGLACLAYFLEFADCQFENLVAAGEHPVLVDAETVLHPHVGIDRRPLRTGVGALTQDSVLLTLLFPHELESVHGVYEGAGAGVPSTTAGFGVSSDPVELPGLQTPTIEAVNTDVMAVAHEPVEVERGDNVPTVARGAGDDDGGSGDGRPEDCPPTDYRDAVVEGFEATYDRILELRSGGRLPDLGVPDSLAGVENRVVYRPTMRYASVVRSLTSRACLADGARFGVEMEDLAVPLCDGTVEEPRPWGVYDGERRALARLDPPRFTARTDEVTLRMDGTPVGVDADATGLQRARDRLAAADPADRREQVEFVRGSLGGTPSPDLAVGDAPGAGREPVDDDALREEAAALLDRIEDAAVRVGDAYHWGSVAPDVGPGDWGPFALRPDNGSLYTGRCGIALLAGGLYRITGEERYREFVLDAVRPVREAIAAGEETPALTGLGGAAGVGSVAYGLGALGALLDDDSLLTDATGTVDYVTTERIERDDTYDVVGGAAGTALGLLGLHDRRPDPELVSAAVECGDHLLANRRAAGDGTAWATVGDDPLTGFAHGASGIAYALARLYGVTGHERYREGALDAVAFEAGEYDADAGNWRDPRDWGEQFPDQWCYGRSGIGLARLGMADHLDDGRVERDVDRALASFPDRGLSDTDHLCCGNAGRAAFLLAAGRRRGATGDARELLGGVLARKRAAGTYRTLAYTDEITEPTLFRGLAGIGYQLLRVTARDRLPCVALLE